ncbi:uncharacterized protein [Miscanthus floridulus]|uniref:uncharacterized protein isoform X3 n=1 Tax=Miscanthus floridulus TaxID=154761 RepID=UPI0034581177
MEVDDSHDTLVNKSEENDFEKKGTSDPVVYQLVRVEGDGTLVPATEDDVLQFDLPPIEDVGHVEEFFNNDCMLLKKPDLEDGSSKLETLEVHTQKLGADLEDKEPLVEPKGIQTAVEMILANDGDKGNHLREAPEVPLKVSSEKGHIEAVDSKGVRNLQGKVYSAVAKPKIKRGLTRKHHRAWTLCEVVKLVDGVARFGAGKWSEIRKLSFASYSYRTSVDLKDKWRNLIRATKTQLPAQKDQGAGPRKINPSIIPIPPSILLRVKELNELQLQGGGFTAPVKFSGQDSKVLQGKGSGFL